MSHSEPRDVTLQAMTERVQKAFRSWHTDQRYASELSNLLRFQKRVRQGESASRATDFLLRHALNELTAYAPEQANLLILRFDQGLTMTKVGKRFNWGQSTLYKQQHAAFEEIAKILLQQDLEVVTARSSVLHQDLPPLSTTPLVGIEPKLKVIEAPLRTITAPWLIGMWGMGGIGKTSLADALARRLLMQGYVDRVIWISAKLERVSGGGMRRPILGAPYLDLSSLKDLLVERVLQKNRAEWHLPDFEQIDELVAGLRAKPHLLVLDNLETAPNVAELLPFLRTLVNPGKIVLTSRVQLHDEEDIFEYQVPPLTPQECHILLLQEGQLRHIQSLQHVDESISRRIYEVVGGNPLAIRLVAGQLRMYSVESVLHDLKQVSGVGETLYHFLFEWLWNALSESSRQVLVAMVLASQEGVGLSTLARLSRLDLASLKAALTPLVTQNLVDVRNEADGPVYSIHNLTRTFLHDTTAKG